MSVKLLLNADYQCACNASVAANYQLCNSTSEDIPSKVIHP